MKPTFYFSSFPTQRSTSSERLLYGGTSGRQTELVDALNRICGANLHLYNVLSPSYYNTNSTRGRLPRFTPPSIFLCALNYLPPAFKLFLFIVVILFEPEANPLRPKNIVIYDQVGILALLIYPLLRILKFNIVQHFCEYHSMSDYPNIATKILAERCNSFIVGRLDINVISMTSSLPSSISFKCSSIFHLPSYPPPSIPLAPTSFSTPEVPVYVLLSNGAPRDGLSQVFAALSSISQQIKVLILGVSPRFYQYVHTLLAAYSISCHTSILPRLTSDQFIDILRNADRVILPRGKSLSMQYCFPSRVTDIIAYSTCPIITASNPDVSVYLHSLGLTNHEYKPSLPLSLSYLLTNHRIDYCERPSLSRYELSAQELSSGLDNTLSKALL